jgi:hypothetical protein
MALIRRVDDYCDKYIATDTAGKAAAIVIISPRSHPQSVELAASAARAARLALGPVLGAAVLQPAHVGVVQGCSFSVTPYMSPLSAHRLIGKFERWSLQSVVLDWLGQVAHFTNKPIPACDTKHCVVSPLEVIEGHGAFDAGVRSAARHALCELDARRWRPATVVAHNDLWWGNLLHSKARRGLLPFYVIDWAGASMQGVPVYDLVRISMSLGVSVSRFDHELTRLCGILDCRDTYLMGYLLVAMGTLWENRGEWPVENFTQNATRCIEYLKRALDRRH